MLTRLPHRLLTRLVKWIVNSPSMSNVNSPSTPIVNSPSTPNVNSPRAKSLLTRLKPTKTNVLACYNRGSWSPSCSHHSNSMLKNHITHPHCEALKRVAKSEKSSMSRDMSIFVYNSDVLREQFAGLVIQRETRLTPASLEMCMCLKDHLNAQDRKQDESTLETPVDFKEDILDAEAQVNKAIPLSDEEIALDNASSEGFMSGPGSRGEEAEAEANYGYDVYHDDY
nr:zinc finger BED domain-containing protein RICESLEEPER 2 [Tanacetum cinerariifolium]